MADAEIDLDTMLADTVAALEVRPVGSEFEGFAPAWFGQHLFGGFVVGQAVYAAGLTAPQGRRIHSLHAYFVRPARADSALRHRVSTVRDGRTFAVRHVETTQGGDTVFWMSCSYTSAGADLVYEPALDSAVPDPQSLPAEMARGPWEVARLGPTEPEPDGTVRSTGRAWVRICRPLGDDPVVADAVLAFFTDMTGVGGHPVAVKGVRNWVSLDHSVWFHRPLRADAWLYYDVHTLVADEQRALIRGVMYGPDRRLGLSMAQEALIQRR
jgi:acyl-CoA thioesterase-2